MLGLPLVASHEKAAPLVVWSGSHRILRRCFREALGGHPASAWTSLDLTDAYQAARRQVFDRCERVELPGKLGESVLLDRHLLHGVAPWPDGVPDLSGCGRMVAYFRPLLENIEDWRDLGP